MRYINTIADLEAQNYGLNMAGYAGNDLLKAAGALSGVHTSHDGAQTAPTGYLASLYNQVYGQKVWSMLNRECNALSVISKRPYTSSGWRVLSERPAGGSGATLSVGTTGAIGAAATSADLIGGVAENQSIGTGGLQAIAPSYAQLYLSPKTVAHQFEFSEVALEMAKIDDGIGDLRAQMREDMGKHHAEMQNKMLVMPLEFYGESSALADLDNNYLSLYKVVTSQEELAQADTDNLFTDAANSDGLSHIYGSNRDAASFLDATVDFGDGYVASDVRSLTLSRLNSMIRDLRIEGGSPKVILTGYDTIQALADLLQAQERFMDRKEIVPTVNGVRGVKGQEVGFRVSTYYDIPLIPVKDMASTSHSTVTGIADLMFLDTDHLWLSVMKPTQYLEDGITNGNPFGVGRLGNTGLYRTIGEVGCSFFKGQGKITNLQ
jgi:hypothetical protein